MSEPPEEAAQSQDTTRDWAGEEAEALRQEQERLAELLRKQREKE